MDRGERSTYRAGLRYWLDKLIEAVVENLTELVATALILLAKAALDKAIEGRLVSPAIGPIIAAAWGLLAFVGIPWLWIARWRRAIAERKAKIAKDAEDLRAYREQHRPDLSGPPP